MKSSWKKLRGLAPHRVKDKTGNNNLEFLPDLKEDIKCMTNLERLQRYYERLYKASSSVANHSLGFSEAVKGMSKLLSSTHGLFADGEMGHIFKMVGKVQFEVAKLFDSYAKHVLELISIPAETLLNELQTVEEANNKYDEKRAFHDHLSLRIAKSRLKVGKSDIYAERQLQTAKEQLDELAKIVDSSVLALENRHRHTLIAKASCHHTVQLHLFRKAFASLNKIEPYLNLVAKESNIDRTVRFEEQVTNESGSELDSNEHAFSNRDEPEEFASISSVDQEICEEKGTESRSSARLSDHVESIPGYSSLARLSEADGTITSEKHGAEEQIGGTRAVTSFLDTPTQQSHSASKSAIFPNNVSRNVRSSRINLTACKVEVKAASPEHSTLEKGFLNEDWDATNGLSQGISHISSPVWKQPGFRCSESKAHPATSQNLVDASSPVATSPALERPFSFGTSGQDYPEFLQPCDSSFTQSFNKGHSQSGPLTFMGNPWQRRNNIVNHNPWSSKCQEQSESIFKSGPIGDPCAGRSFVSPKSPTISSPSICELYKLPPPPMEDISERYPTPGWVPESRLASASNHKSFASRSVSPLPSPQSIRQSSFPHPAGRPTYKPHHSRSSRYPRYPQVTEPEDEECSVSPPLQPLPLNTGNMEVFMG